MSTKSNHSNYIYKIVIAGPVGAGKTQATNILSDKETISTEANTADMMTGDKKTITVAMDYGTMTLDTGEQVHIYGTPGHDRFDFMWEILSENALGLILLINAQSADPAADMQSYLDSFMPLIQSGALIVGVTHTENAPTDLRQRLLERLNAMDITADIMMIDARDRQQVSQVVHALITTIDDKLLA